MLDTSATSALIAPTAKDSTKTANAPIAAPEPSAGLMESKPEMCHRHRYDNAPLRNSVVTATAEPMSATCIRVIGQMITSFRARCKGDGMCLQQIPKPALGAKVPENRIISKFAL